MSLIAVGLSFRTAPLPLLERAVLPEAAVPDLLADLLRAATVSEAMVVSTCNRLEVYGEVERFHVGLQEISGRLARATGLGDDLVPHLYVHFGDRAVQHLFGVACGLDSMVVGESQVLGQVRAAFRAAQANGAVGRSLGSLVPQALRVGKRAHSETGIDAAAPSVVSAGLVAAEAAVGRLAGRPGLVVGAGTMGSLAVATMRRLAIGPVAVANRSPERGERFGGPTVGLGDPAALAEAVAAADVVVSCTGATGIVLGLDVLRAAVGRRGGRPLAVVDLALPHDVDPAAAALAGLTLVTLAGLDGTTAAGSATDVAAVRAIVADEVSAHVAASRAATVAPTVVALRNKADDVVALELARLSGRLPSLDGRARAEIEVTVRRVVDKLLHAPTVRVQSLAASPGGEAYAEALRDLFDLDPALPDALATADLSAGGGATADPTTTAPAAAGPASADLGGTGGASGPVSGPLNGSGSAAFVSVPRGAAVVPVPLPRTGVDAR